MSGRLVSAVFDSALPAWLKPYAAAFAIFAADDGTRVYPSVARVARMVGHSPRAVQTAASELRRRGILEPLERHGRACLYRFHAAALPSSQLPLFPQPAMAKAGTEREISTDSTGVDRQWASDQIGSGLHPILSDPSSTRTFRAREKTKGNHQKTGTDR